MICKEVRGNIYEQQQALLFIKMTSESIGLKAQGLCLDPLLQYGVPGPEVIDSIIKELDQQLSQNTRELEDCMKGLLDVTNDLSEDKKFTNPIEALNFLGDAQLLDKTACYDPDSEDITKLLRHVLQVVEKQPGCEEEMLQNLLHLSAEEGLALPTKSSHADHVGQSVLSINTVTDKSEHLNETLWRDLCMKFRRYLVEKLNRLPVGGKPPAIDLHRHQRLRCVQSLCALFPAQEIWTRYRGLRTQQLDTCLAARIKKEDSVKFIASVNQFERATPKVITMMMEDFELLNSGVFLKVISTMKGLHDIYLERLSDELSRILDNLHGELSSGSPSPQKDMPKSSSEMGRLGHLRGMLRKQHSKSLDSLLGKDESFTDLQAVPTSQLEGLVRLVGCMTTIESYVNSLHSAMVWEVAGHAHKKTASKTNLKSVLKSKHNTNGKPVFSPRSFEESGLLPESIPPPYGVSNSGNAEESYASFTVVEGGSEEESWVWDWRSQFRRLLPDVAKGVELYMREVTERCLRLEQEYLASTGTLETVQVPAGLIGGRLDYPKKVAKAVLVVMQTAEKLVPLARAGSEGPFQLLRSSFVDAVTLSVKNIAHRLTKLSGEVNEKIPLPSLYAVLSSSAFVRNHLLHLDNVLGSEDSSKKRFGVLYRQYCELVDTLSHQVIEYHTQLLSTSVLHDAESHNWGDSKDFYENERCSFSVQMWHVHMCGLCQDLWAVCPPKLAQSILSAVLQEGLTVLAQRYSRAKPSYRRRQQFVTDITTILLVTSELLIPGCSSASKYLDVTISHQPHFTIHTLCSSLMAALAVAGAPLETLYKVYKKGFNRKKCFGGDHNGKGYPAHWLHWIRPGCFPLGQIRLEQLQTTTALYLQLRLLACQPETSWTLLLQSLLMKDYTLPIMLLTQMSKLTAPPRRSSSTGDEGKGSAKQPASTDTACEGLFQAFVDILLLSGHHFPAALSHVLTPVIERSDTWEIFDYHTVLGKSHPVPPWIEAVLHSLESFAVRVCDPAIRLLIERDHHGPEVEPLSSHFHDLPCGCPVLGGDSESASPVKEPVAEALYSLVTQMVEDIYTLPTPICMFFNHAQTMLQEKKIQAPHSSVGLMMLATSVRMLLSDCKRVEGLIGGTLSESVQDNLKMLSECVYHVLTATAYHKSSGTPRIAGMFLKANRNWLMEQIETITDHFGNDAFELPETHPLDDCTNEYIENLLITVSSGILSRPEGEQAMHKINNLVINNLQWILQQLDIPPLITRGDSPQKADSLFHINIAPPAGTKFNPLEAFSCIGDGQFDHAAIGSWSWDWQKLLQADLGLTESGFRCLLYHRHEMQEGAFLEEIEMKPVRVLRAKFDLDPADLV